MMAQSVYLSFVFRVGVEAEVLQCADFVLHLFSLLQSMSDTPEKHETYLQTDQNGIAKCSFPARKLLMEIYIFVKI